MDGSPLSPTTTVTTVVVRGNIVTPTEILYGGYVIVRGENIAHVIGHGAPLPVDVRDAIESAANNGAMGNLVTVGNISVCDTQSFVIPGFVDIHNHGLGSFTSDEVLEHWLNPTYSLLELARCGTLSTLASVIFSSKQKRVVEAVIHSVESHVGRSLPGCAVIEGIHAEGPIVADYGGLPSADTDLSLDSFKLLCSTMPSMCIMTISPSCESRMDFARLKHLVDLGVRPSLGHDRKATESDIIFALRCCPSAEASLSELTTGASSAGPSSSSTISSVSLTQHNAATVADDESTTMAVLPSAAKSVESDESAAVRRRRASDLATWRRRAIERRKPTTSLPLLTVPFHTTHYCNVMQFHHREPSLVNFCMTPSFPKSDRYRGCQPPTLEIIADLIHVHPLAIQAVLSSRKKTDVAIISDCISSYHPGRRLKYNGRQIAVRAEGGCYLCDNLGNPTSTLAGSTVTLADQFWTLMTYFGLDMVQACWLLATNPARIANIDHRVGSIQAGRKANMLVLDSGMGKIVRRMVYGKWLDTTQDYDALRAHYRGRPRDTAGVGGGSTGGQGVQDAPPVKPVPMPPYVMLKPTPAHI